MIGDNVVPYSTATTPEGVMQDIGAKLLKDQQALGGAAPSLGITRPMPDMSTPEKMLGAMSAWTDEQVATYGGDALDMGDTKSANSYGERRWKFLSSEEGIRTVAYDDATGRPLRKGQPKEGLATVGVGFNLDRPDARKVLKDVLGFSDSRFDKVYSGEDALDEVEVRTLFDHTAKEAESFVTNRFKGVPLKEHQRLSLISLAFNNPSLIGPKLTKAVQSGDWSTATDEILNNSNRKKSKGLAARRYREATTFAGVTSEASEFGIPAFNEYMKRFA